MAADSFDPPHYWPRAGHCRSDRTVTVRRTPGVTQRPGGPGARAVRLPAGRPGRRRRSGPRAARPGGVNLPPGRPRGLRANDHDPGRPPMIIGRPASDHRTPGPAQSLGGAGHRRGTVTQTAAAAPSDRRGVGRGRPWSDPPMMGPIPARAGESPGDAAR
eukprot:323530-Hanusia_phi.AAC.1